jgi:acetyl esterase/lipase
LAPLAQKFADLGWPVALIEYRRIIGNPDAMMSDVVSAIEEVVGRNNKLILIGHSAGGHLALLAANKLSVLGVIALAPVTDLVKTEELDLDEGAASDFLGAPASLRADLDPMRQPVLTVSTTLIHGALDIRVPVAFARDYVAKAASSHIKLIELENIGHFEVIDPRHAIFNLIESELAELI